MTMLRVNQISNMNSKQSSVVSSSTVPGNKVIGQNNNSVSNLDDIYDVIGPPASKDDPSVYVYDLRNGTLQTTFQHSQSDVNGLCMIGDEYFATSQYNKAMLHVYSWKKDQPLYKTPIQERGGPICCTNDGNYCAMGTSSGSVYIWEIATGTLLRIWEAHYNKITCISFTKDDFYLVTCGDDGIINCWSLENILDRELTLLNVKNSFSDHSLGITSIYCSYGGSNSRLFTVSMDRTCKIWDLVSGKAVASILYPTYLTAVTCNASENTLYVGGGDGVIYQTDLISLNPNSFSGGQSGAAAGSTTAVTSTTIDSMDGGDKRKRFVGHNKSISSLGLSFDGSLLISGSIDGVCNIWDSFSRQIVRSITNVKGALSSITVTINPIDTLNFNSTGDNNSIHNNKKIMEPLQSFEKYSSNAIDRNHLPKKLKQIDHENDYFDNRSRISTDNIQQKIQNSDQLYNNQLEFNNLNNTNSFTQNSKILELEKYIENLNKTIENLKSENNNVKELNVKLGQNLVDLKSNSSNINNNASSNNNNSSTTGKKRKNSSK
eukprot:gene2099-2587_t